MLKIGVLLPGRFSDAGDFLADARALDAAGVDSRWLPGDGLDPWLVLAGVALLVLKPKSGARRGAGSGPAGGGTGSEALPAATTSMPARRSRRLKPESMFLSKSRCV